MASKRSREVAERFDVRRGDAFNRDAQRDLKKAAIIRVASAAFHSRGFERTSLDEVAVALGITKPALYQYFKNKEEILYECHLLAIRHGEAAALKAAAHPGSGFERLLVYFSQYLKAFLDDIGSCGGILDVHSLGDRHRNEILKLREAAAKRVEALVSAGIEDGSIVACEPRLAAFFVFGVINWFSIWYRPDGPKSLDEIVQAFAQFLRTGLANTPARTN